MKKIGALVVILLVFGLTGFTSCKGRNQDRAYFVSLMDQYIQALLTHNPSAVPLADNVKMVENIQATQVGEGLWKTITSGPTDFKIYVADPVAGQVGFMGVIENNGQPALFGARLKVVDRKIAEIEHMVSPISGQIPRGLIEPRTGLVTKLAARERVPREQMLQAALDYYDSLEQNNGALAPYADECQRNENGMTTANNQDPTLRDGAMTSAAGMTEFLMMSCAEQMDTGMWRYITDINQIRLAAVDEDMGLVMIFSMFNHNGDPNPMPIVNLPGITERANEWGEFTVPAAHIYKIRNGKIHEIEAMAIVGVPFQASDGWSCHRGCLVNMMDNYLAALAKNDPSGVPLAANVKLVENTKPISAGEGLWKTATGAPTDFRIYAADADTGEIGFIGVIENEGRPTIASIRLKVENHKITEIDHLVVPGDDPLNPNMSKPRAAFFERIPKMERTPRARMLEIANSYYDAILQNDGSVAPFADECERRENGGISANDQTQTPEEAAKDDFSVFRKMKCGEQLDTNVMSYITDINNRRLLAMDEEKGLVFAFSIFRHDGEPKVMKIKGVPGITERPNTWGPFDLPAAHIYKIRNGKIHEIEAVGYMAEHGIKSGWE
ncbi:MAG TPA: hypothetical protein VLL97_03480 [Acidobacteriota bacterium]|nr:hypothetical protein [Acidobacteriota bacterium]